MGWGWGRRRRPTDDGLGGKGPAGERMKKGLGKVRSVMNTRGIRVGVPVNLSSFHSGGLAAVTESLPLLLLSMPNAVRMRLKRDPCDPVRDPL